MLICFIEFIKRVEEKRYNARLDDCFSVFFNFTLTKEKCFERSSLSFLNGHNRISDTAI